MGTRGQRWARKAARISSPSAPLSRRRIRKRRSLSCAGGNTAARMRAGFAARQATLLVLFAQALCLATRAGARTADVKGALRRHPVVGIGRSSRLPDRLASISTHSHGSWTRQACPAPGTRWGPGGRRFKPRPGSYVIQPLVGILLVRGRSWRRGRGPIWGPMLLRHRPVRRASRARDRVKLPRQTACGDSAQGCDVARESPVASASP
jgi:hypothetical protein